MSCAMFNIFSLLALNATYQRSIIITEKIDRKKLLLTLRSPVKDTKKSGRDPLLLLCAVNWSIIFKKKMYSLFMKFGWKPLCTLLHVALIYQVVVNPPRFLSYFSSCKGGQTSVLLNILCLFCRCCVMYSGCRTHKPQLETVRCR